MPETTDLAGALAIISARAAEQITTLPLYWQDEGQLDLPDEPAPFVLFRIGCAPRPHRQLWRSGRGANLYRTPSELSAYVFVPAVWDWRLPPTYAEAVAAAFRSFRSGGLSASTRRFTRSARARRLSRSGVVGRRQLRLRHRHRVAAFRPDRLIARCFAPSRDAANARRTRGGRPVTRRRETPRPRPVVRRAFPDDGARNYEPWRRHKLPHCL